MKNKIDITFANEQEIISLVNAKKFDEVIEFGKNLKKQLIITRGAKGAISIFNDQVIENGVDKNLNIKDQHIINGVKKAYNSARLEEIKSGKLKNLVKDNTLIIDSSHNPGGSKSLNDYLQTLNCNKHVIIGMMNNKDHEKFISYFKDISSLTVIDIPNQVNAISGKKLKEKFKNFANLSFSENIEQALKDLQLNQNDIVIITGSIYLTGEVLNLN